MVTAEKEYTLTKSQIAFAWYLIDQGIADYDFLNRSYWEMRQFFESCGLYEMNKVVRKPVYYGFDLFKNSVLILAVSKVGYLVPLHRLMGSYSFMTDVNKWGGIREIAVIGTGHHVGFPFGHTLVAAHYQKGYYGPTHWDYESLQVQS